MKVCETFEEKDGKEKKELVLKAKDMPLIIRYGDKRYVVILTKNDKLILQKPID
jgi:hypothetical protein